MRLILATLAFLLSGSAAFSFSEAHTDKIVRILREGEAQCESLDLEYRFDCFRRVYADAILRTGDYRDYSEAGRALRVVEKTLKTILRENRDRSKPRIQVNGRKLTAVKPGSVKSAAQAFHAARAEAATMLLRADGRSKVHYTKIAQALNSDKFLIRSMLQTPTLQRLAQRLRPAAAAA